MQKDEACHTHLVLLVGEIVIQTNSYFVELTDGWYSVYLEVKAENSFKNDKNIITNNQLLLSLIKGKKLYPGMKIHVVGMKMLASAEGGKEEGKPERTLVDVQYNAISKAKWDAKLGKADAQYLLKNLASLRPNGGLIPLIDIFVLKKYKILEKSAGALKYINNNLLYL